MTILIKLVIFLVGSRSVSHLFVKFSLKLSLLGRYSFIFIFVLDSLALEVLGLVLHFCALFTVA